MLGEFSDNLGNAINTIQLEKGEKILADTINRLISSISGTSSKEVLNSFMQNLIISLDADYAFIGRFIPGFEDRIRTIAVNTPTGSIENFEYTLKGTPCFEVITKDICCYTSGVSDLFPEDIMLKDMGIDAYIGTPLFNSKNEVSGIMVVLKKTPFPSETLARYIFQVFSSRAASELMSYDSALRGLESENQYRNLIESSKNPIYIIVGRKYALVNSAWLNMFEYTAEEVKSPDFSIQTIVEPESRDLIQRRLDNFLAGINQPFQYELKAVSKSGKKYDLDVSVTHLNWQGKRAAQGIYRNITGAKNKEKQLQKELKLSYEHAQMKTAFLADFSLAVQNKLNNFAQKALDLINDKSTNQEAINFAEYIKYESDKLLENVNDILDISNFETGSLPLKIEKFKISEVLKDIVQHFIPIAATKEVNIVCCKKRYNNAVVNADPSKVKQILSNLMSNAVKYTEKGEIQVNYTIRQDDVKVSIADTGVGIEPEKLRSIYKSFVDPNGKYPIDNDGSGLGLIVTRSLVQLMNGKIWVEPNPGGGSIFNFTIPLA